MNKIAIIGLLLMTSLSGNTLPNNLIIRALNGQQAKEFCSHIAHMRDTMFKEYPYLYKASSEEEFLETYFNCPDALLLGVFDGPDIVGFSSSIPLKYEPKELTEPFVTLGHNINDYFYIGVVMIHPSYRGQGLLRSFFEYHEDKARNEGYAFTCFITVKRADDHPCKPVDYKSLDPVWRHFGYELMNDLEVNFAWMRVDTQREMDNAHAVWSKEIK